MSKPYETFDIDLREGKAREDAFVHVLLRTRVEHKRDHWFEKTGNIAIEYEQRCSNGEIKKSGISITESTFHAFEYLPERWLLVPTEVVKTIARQAIKDGREKWIGDGNNHHNALVPIDWFMKPEQTSAPITTASEAIHNDKVSEFVTGTT